MSKTGHLQPRGAHEKKHKTWLRTVPTVESSGELAPGLGDTHCIREEEGKRPGAMAKPITKEDAQSGGSESLTQLPLQCSIHSLLAL